MNKLKAEIVVYAEGYTLEFMRIWPDWNEIRRNWGVPEMHFTVNKLVFFEKKEKPFRLPVEVHPPSEE
jgi:hypothetical protein